MLRDVAEYGPVGPRAARRREFSECLLSWRVVMGSIDYALCFATSRGSGRLGLMLRGVASFSGHAFAARRYGV